MFGYLRSFWGFWRVEGFWGFWLDISKTVKVVTLMVEH